MKKTNEKQLDRIRGALYGVAVGDALGGPLEFMSDWQICNTYGRVTDMIGGGWLNLKPGEVTDDTQMTLCVARGILDALEGDNGLDLVASVGQQFIAWLTASKGTLAAPAPIALPLQSCGAVFACRAFLRLRTGKKQRGRPAGWRPPCGGQRRSDAHRIPWPLLQHEGQAQKYRPGHLRK